MAGPRSANMTTGVVKRSLAPHRDTPRAALVPSVSCSVPPWQLHRKKEKTNKSKLSRCAVERKRRGNGPVVVVAAHADQAVQLDLDALLGVGQQREHAHGRRVHVGRLDHAVGAAGPLQHRHGVDGGVAH